MDAVVAEATIAPGRIDEATEMARTFVIPAFPPQSGHVASYCTRSGDGTAALSCSIFETLEQALASAASIAPPPEAPVRIDSVAAHEVLAAAM